MDRAAPQPTRSSARIAKMASSTPPRLVAEPAPAPPSAPVKARREAAPRPDLVPYAVVVPYYTGLPTIYNHVASLAPHAAAAAAVTPPRREAEARAPPPAPRKVEPTRRDVGAPPPAPRKAAKARRENPKRMVGDTLTRAALAAFIAANVAHRPAADGPPRTPPPPGAVAEAVLRDPARDERLNRSRLQSVLRILREREYADVGTTGGRPPEDCFAPKRPRRPTL